MDRVKELGTYVLLLVGFFILSIILENGLISAMYAPIEGLTSGNYTAEISGLEVTVLDARATSVNGYMKVKIKNTTGRDIDECYAKMDLYSKQGFLAATEYVELKDFKANEERNFDVGFKANEIDRYEVSLVETVPDKSNILNILGWEIDLTDFFGLDLTKIFDFEKIKDGAMGLWSWFTAFCSSIPAWAWFIAGGIVIWNLPSRYLFGIFP